MVEVVDLHIIKGKSLGATLKIVNAKYGCVIAKGTLGDHVRAARVGLDIGKVGRPWGDTEGGEAFISQAIVDVWAGWLGMSTSNNGCHLLGVAENMLLDLC